MPVKRRLQVEDNRNTPVKRHTKDRNYSPLTGTLAMTPAAKTKGDVNTELPFKKRDFILKNNYSSGNYKTSGTTVNALEAQEPQTETERMDFLRSKLEGSLEALMKTRQELESLLPVEGNSELRSFLLMGPADLNTELKRHKELSSKVNCHINASQMQDKWLQGAAQTGSSYDFLKNILNG